MSMFGRDGKTSHQYLVEKLTQFLLTISVSTTTTEHAFSALKFWRIDHVIDWMMIL